MMGLKFTGKVPFRHVVITGLICDSEGKKMSKSKGNVLDPIDIIDGISIEDLVDKRTSNLMLNSVREPIAKATRKQFPEGIPAYGTDALRFTFCSLAANARQVRFDIQRVEGYRNFCNKLWNASRFVLISTAEEGTEFDDGAFQYTPADQWILSLLQTTIAQCHKHFENYRFDLLANTLYEFVWHEFCDWYLELSKTVIYDEDALPAIKRGTRRTLIHVLSRTLKLLHPITPFITEAIWQRMRTLTSEYAETIMLSRYPQVETQFVNPTIEIEFEWIKKVVQSIRTIRSEMSIAPSKKIPLLVRYQDNDLKNRFDTYASILTTLSKVSDISHLAPQTDIPVCASAIVGDLELLIPIADLIDKDAELTRLNKELIKLEKDIAFAENKLHNPTFTTKAPADIIASIEEKLIQAKLAKEKLMQHRAKIELL